jgi:hypothetical protein
VPGHPVLRTAMPELMKGLGVNLPGHAIMKWQQFEDRTMHNLEYGTRTRKALTLAKPIAAAALAIGAIATCAWAVSKSRNENGAALRHSRL